ncbi:MAG TPA: NAD(P)/FAD-dependent oxidoreductase, partial [Polyangiaceae bacterium]|nr:NAD(P)/FAD-dependent oxidoreductase [Polyangiaceae bacterium]
FSFAPNPEWTRAYSPQPEIHAYLRACAERFGVLPHVRFGHEVRKASWKDDRWHLETSEGAITADVLVAGVGALSAPALPQLQGIERFEGKVMHSARWDHAHDLTGRRVAVIGTGASAIQFVPAIQPKVAALTIFQRTPPWILPRGDRPIGARARRIYRAAPIAQRIVRGAIQRSRELLVLAFRDPRVMRVAEGWARKYLASEVSDPILRDKLTPDYTLGCKRILISDDYLPAITQPNVTLVTAGIAEVRERSIVDRDGVVHDVDTIVFGTGFKATDPPIAKHVHGRHKKTLAEVWQGNPRAHVGTTVSGFPNFFMLTGPNTGLGHSSMIIMIEAQIEHLLGALRWMRTRDAAAIEPTEEAQAAFVANCERRMHGTVWTTGGCSSWYLDATGKNSTLWPGSTSTFRRRVAHFRPSEYRAW